MNQSCNRPPPQWRRVEDGGAARGRVRAWRQIMMTVVVLATAAMVGCQSLPSAFERPAPTQAPAPVTEGPFADFAAEAGSRLGNGKSGFLLLHRNDDGFRWRLALVDSAVKTLDLQTFIWSGDFSGQPPTTMTARVWMVTSRSPVQRRKVHARPGPCTTAPMHNRLWTG